jgi:hypothetical protein
VLVVARGGEIVFERFADGFTADTPHALYSGTKSSNSTSRFPRRSRSGAWAGARA